VSAKSTGNPDCPLCKGQGYIPVESKGPPAKRTCRCVLQQDLIANVERGLKRLSKQPPVKESPLLKHVENNLWINASKRWFLPHLRHVALRQSPTWFFKVITDADLMTAWLSSAALKGQSIFDADVLAQAVSLRYLTLVDLIDPPNLLIIRVGVKAARNVAMPEVFLEALSHRAHEGKTVWVWDTPVHPLRDGHLCYSSHVEEFLSDYGKIKVPPGHGPAQAVTTATTGKAQTHVGGHKPLPRVSPWKD